MPPAVTVIIVNYNSGQRLQRAFSALAAQTFTDFDVIVVDNASNDGSADGIDKGALRLQIIANSENLGFAAANNQAAKVASGEWLAFLNPDAYPEPDWLEQLMAAAARYPAADAFGSTQVNADDPERLDGAGDGYHVFGLPYRGHFGWPVSALPGEGECFAPCAAAALYRRATFEALGGFDESFFCYGEDVDLGFRLRLAGGRAVQASLARVLHEGSGITGRRSDFTLYHGHRNRVWTFVKNMPAALFWPALPFHLLLNFALLVRFIQLGAGGAYWRAMKDAACGLGPVLEKRRAVQRARRAPLSEIARALTWSPLRAIRRGAVIRAYRPPKRAP
jgi:GT2 family glycosyltransferase